MSPRPIKFCYLYIIEDALTFNEYGEGFSNIADWRRHNIDTLVEQTFHAVKKLNPNVVFGISPSGIWANKSHNALGSDTRGFKSYNDLF